jgi:hypothetical protein
MKVPLFLMIAIVISACSGYHYVASPQFVPLNTKKGELQFNAYISGAQVGYALSNHFSVFATAYNRFGSTDGSGNPVNGLNKENSGAARRGCRTSEFNAGLGYFKFHDPFVLELLLGGGAGKMSYKGNIDLNDNYDFRMTADRKNIYLQPDFGIKFSHNIELGFFARFNYLQYDHITTAMDLSNEMAPEKSDLVFYGHKTKNLVFIESGASFKAGGENIKFHMQMSPTVNLYPQHIRYPKINVNVGFSYNIGMMKKKGLSNK